MAAEQCPIQNVPAASGGQVDARVGIGRKQKLRFTYTPVSGSGGDPDASCAFRDLAQRAVDNPIMDVTQACRRCMRAVRLQSTTI